MPHENSFQSLEQQIVGDCYTSTEPMDNLLILCDEFGSRFGGTEGERRAAEFFQAKMKAYGLRDVHLEPVDYTGWIRGEATLQIVSPVQKMIPCISLPHSPPADLEGTIVDMGDGAPEDFERRADEIKGKIVLTTSHVAPNDSKRRIHRIEKYGRSLLAGASGFVFVNHYPGYGPATGGIGHGGQEGLIPGFSVCYEDGAYLQRLVKRTGEVKIRMTSTDQCRPMTSWNVVGDLPGVEKPGEIVMLGCHYDGHDISQGAGDPASGAVSVLEAARLLAKYASNLPRSVRFVLWGIEEIGLLGSRAYAAAHAGELDQIRFYLNLDSAGAKTNNRDIVLNEWPALQPLVERWRDEMASSFAVGQRTSAHSDHFPFFMAGVPTGGMQSAVESLEGRGYGHTCYDTVDKVDLDDLRQAAALAARLALRIASEEDWPVARRDGEVVQELLDTPEYREEQALRARVRARYAQVSQEA
ncbi:MAG: M28 family peptidase [Anaerolineae bacterium]|jgi:Iap family predicted aminopeptidase